MAPRQITLVDLARAAGVSRTTASNAFNRPDQLSADLRERVLKVAGELGYAGPNALARMLRKGSAGAIGLVFSDSLLYAFTDPTTVALLQGIAAACEHARAGLLILPEARHDVLSQMIQRAAVDGFIVYCDAKGSNLSAAVGRRGLPVVAVDSAEATADFHVGIDDRAAAAAAAAHLLALGHRRFGILSLDSTSAGHAGPIDVSRLHEIGYTVTRERLLGYLATLASVGISAGNVPVEECPGNSAEIARGGVAIMLARDPRPTALLAMSDQLAQGALLAAADLGLVVPGDLSIVGFDDAPGSDRLRPPLTTIRQPLVEKGRLAASLLLDGAGEGRYRLAAELVVRGSTAPPPG